MKRPGAQLILDTNIVVHLIRGKRAGQVIEREYGVGARRPRAIVPIVVKGEIRSLALQLGWAAKKLRDLDGLLAELPAVDISSEVVIESYAELDHASRAMGRRMGKNDLWIAAVTRVQGGVLLTTDRDFEHLDDHHIEIEYIDPEKLRERQR